MSSPSSSNHEGNDAWLMKIELKREEPMEINKDEGIKKLLPASKLDSQWENCRAHLFQTRLSLPMLDFFLMRI